MFLSELELLKRPSFLCVYKELLEVTSWAEARATLTRSSRLPAPEPDGSFR